MEALVFRGSLAGGYFFDFGKKERGESLVCGDGLSEVERKEVL